MEDPCERNILLHLCQREFLVHFAFAVPSQESRQQALGCTKISPAGVTLTAALAISGSPCWRGQGPLTAQGA
jgi:hypothetical protein